MAGSNNKTTSKGLSYSPGVTWPVVTDGRGGGRVSTSAVAKAALIAGYIAVGNKGAIERVEKERNWRANYSKHYFDHVRSSVDMGESSVVMAKACLDSLHGSFRYIGKRGNIPLSEAMKSHTPNRFQTERILGRFRENSQNFPEESSENSENSTTALRIPHPSGNLTGETLKKQARKWELSQVIEPSAANGLIYASELVSSKEWKNRIAPYAFVILGAGAALSPTLTLLEIGATVVGIDLPGRGHMWSKLMGKAAIGKGELIVPTTEGKGELTMRAGCDLLRDAPEIADWISTVCPNKTLVIGTYAYMDASDFVRIAIAMDAIAENVLKKRPNSILASLATPTDIYLRPEATRLAAKRRFNTRPGWFRLVNRISRGKMLAPNAEGIVLEGKLAGMDIVNGVVHQQGPNYMLAKRLQQWRALVARSEGTRVSINVAPASRTISVVKNRLLRAAYAGVDFFPPFEVFEAETTSSVMAAGLIRDIFDDQSASNPKLDLKTPLALLTDNACHGGAWSAGVTLRSASVIAAVVGFSKEYNVLPIAAAAGVGAVVLKLRSRL